jgi:predicted enzyme related to lactoylglutathione lyase
MPSPRGKFIWYDVMTNDTKAASDFYKDVVGWSAAEFPMADGSNYTVFSQGQTRVSGLMKIPQEACDMGAKPCWSGYIGVDDVDADAKRIADAGGKIMRPPTDIPNVGRFAVAADTGNAMFLIFKPSTSETPAEHPMIAPGFVGWHELYAGNIDREWDFYAKLFGWTKARSMDMGAMGVYQTFAINGIESGGMMNRPPQVPAPFWNYYLGVDSVAAAAERAKQRGATVVNGPMEVPGGAWIVQALDPQGAFFSVISASK